MKLGSLEGRPRRAARGRVARSVALRRCLRGRADACRRRSTIGHAAVPRLTELADSLEAGPHRASAVRSGEMRVAAAAGLSMGSTAPPMSIMSRWCGRRAARKCRTSFWTDPLMYQGISDIVLGAARPIPARRRSLRASISRRKSWSSWAMCRWARPASRRQDAIRLIMLVNDVTLRNITPRRTRQGFRLLAVEAAFRLHAGRGHAGRTRQVLGTAPRSICRC